MAGSWKNKESAQARTRQAVRSMVPGTIDGRVQQASPVDRRSQQRTVDSDDSVWVGPDQPDYAPTGKLWFDTDDTA